MDKTQILLIINSLLLTFIGLLFTFISFFLKDLHKEFKKLIEKVNTVYSDLHAHTNLFDNISKLYQKQIDRLAERIEKLEELFRKKTK